MDVIFTLSDIQNTAKDLLKVLPAPCTVALYGEMGAGKTTLITAICRELGVEDAVSSPTFSIINEYVAGNGQPVYHLDLYRIKDEQEAIDAGVEECFYSNTWCFTEWPERIARLLPEKTVSLFLDRISGEERRLRFAPVED